MYLPKILDGLKTLAISSVYIFGICYFVETKWETHPKSYCMSFTRGYGFLSLLYYLSISLIGIYWGFYTTFMCLIGFFGVVLCILMLTMIERDYKNWTHVLGVTGLVILVKLSHSSYFAVTVLLDPKSQIKWSLFYFLVFSIICELILLMYWSLFPFLSLKSESNKRLPFVIWNSEFFNVMFNCFLLIVYASYFNDNQGQWNDNLLNVLFAFNMINLFAFTTPLYLQKMDDERRVKLVKVAPIYLLSMHIICDVSIMTAIYCADNYIHKLIFIVAILFKFYAIGVQIWAAVTTFSPAFTVEPVAIWKYSICDVDDN